jgi:hypothetical protein
MSAEITLGWNNAKLQAGAKRAGDIIDAQSARMSKALGSIGAAIGAGAVGFILAEETAIT